jgi:hypothetical protein
MCSLTGARAKPTWRVASMLARRRYPSCGDKFSLSVSLLKSAYVHSLDRAARETRRRICRDDALEVDPPPAHDAVDFVVRAGLSGGDNCERRPSRRATRAATEVRSDCEKVR